MLPPEVTDCEAGEADRVKSGAAVTLRVTVAAWTREPLVPVMVSVKLPWEVPVDVVIVRVELDPAATEEGLNEAVAPAGSPLAVRLSEPLKPLVALVFTV